MATNSGPACHITLYIHAYGSQGKVNPCILKTITQYLNDGSCACKGVHSDALCCYALVLLGSRDLLSI